MIWRPTPQQQIAEMQKMWDIFRTHEDKPIQIRAIQGKGTPGSLPVQNITFTPKDYPQVVDRQLAFENKAISLNTLGYNVYFPFNPIDPSFRGDEYNGLAVKDEHIACRRFLLVDFDRFVTDSPATDEEIDEVFAAAHEFEKDFFFNVGKEPITFNSGNGAHIYLPLHDLSNTLETKVLCQKILQGLAKKYNTTNVKVDTSVYNASRITKVPGTIARKGIETEDRPYRMASVLD